MQSSDRVIAFVSATDLEQAKTFYGSTLGFTRGDESVRLRAARRRHHAARDEGRGASATAIHSARLGTAERRRHHARPDDAWGGSIASRGWTKIRREYGRL